MKTITIEGKFKGSVNNYCRIDVYRTNPHPYDFSKSYEGDFSETLSDLENNTSYFIDITGFTFTDFDLKISGDFVGINPITAHYHKTDFKPGYTITTNP